MSGGLDGPGPDERSRPTGRRSPDGIRVDDADDVDGDAGGRRAVLSALVEDEPGVLAAVTGLFARRQVDVERLVAEPADGGERSRVTFAVTPPHPGVEQVTGWLGGLRPVVTVEECDLDAARRLTASVDGT